MLVSPTYAALVNFDNCLPAPTIASNPQKLQFVPLDVSVKFDLTNSLHNLNITVYGNVSGTADQSSSYPSPDDPQWANQNATVGKIVDLNTANNKYSTLITTIDVVSFSPYSGPTRFCDSTIQGECPLGPVFYANASDLSSLRSFSVQHDMLSSYRFATLSSTLLIKSGDAAATELGCISVDVTPDLGSALKSALAYVPLVILILVGVATVTAAIYSPWGTTDPFHWTSNYGRDEDVLRLVTPGFGDCLQYMQFAVLTGALSLNYPGYYQPVVSQVAWSTLMFNQSFLSPGNERNPVKDGVYTVNGTYGLDALQQYVGMESARDIWPGMIIWLLAVVVAITLIIQLAFAFRWLHRELANIPEEDLRSKNMPFTVGNVIRIVCVSQAARGWIGYVILFLHAVVLVFGFFLNALQTLVEVIARLAGAGGYEGGVTRGGLVKVFGMRQLSRRTPRRSVGTRQSMGSEAAMLAHTDERLSSQFDGSRPRSLSGSSAMLLNRAAASEGRTSAFYESGSAHGGTHSRANSSGLFTPTTPGGNPTFQGAGHQTTGSNSPKSGPLFAMQAHDPYYRPPRPRNKRVDMSGGEKGRTGGRQRAGSDAEDDIMEGPMSERGTPVPAYIPAPKDDLDLDDPRQSRKDYAVREVDFYYRVRGPPLSQSGTRKLKTGPADPTGPVSSATGFFRNLFRGKTKESGKGFEVVRSARAPPPGLLPEGDDVHEPYRDEPDEQATAGHSRRVSGSDRSYPDTDSDDNNRTGEALISLPQVESGGAIELPSRIGSQHSSPSGAPQPSRPSRRDSRSLAIEDDTASHRSLPVVTKAVSEEAHYPAPQLHPSSSGTGRLPFSAASSPSRDRNFSIASTTASTSSSRQHGNGTERPSSMGYVAQHRTRDYIHEASPDEPSFTGSAAELVDEPHHPDGSH
ncbi:hypothetical protein APSETT445_004281 [Aspergillus pseudonomiae]